MVERMIAATFELLGSDDFVAKTNPPLPCSPADSDWSGFAQWLLQRVQDISAVGGHGCASCAGGRSPTPAGRDGRRTALVLDLADLLEAWIARQDAFGKVDGRIVCSRCFRTAGRRRPRPTRRTTSRRARSPATARSARAPSSRSTASTTSSGSTTAASTGRRCADPRRREAPLYGASVVEILFFFTPEYEARAWTRLERAIGYVYTASPMFVYLDASTSRSRSLPAWRSSAPRTVLRPRREDGRADDGDQRPLSGAL